MTALYHRRFYADVWLAGGFYLGALTGASLGAEPLFAVLPFIALFGAVVTAFDASYLIMARHYAARLERFINERLGEEILVGAELEDAYLFPLSKPKVVTIRFGGDFSWFGFVTLFFTLLGVAAYALGFVMAWEAIETGPGHFWFAAALGPLTLASLAAGLWWFARGTGEARLELVLGRSFSN